jgi:hypothetical protein
VVQQARRGDTSLLGDLPEGGTAPPVPRHQPLSYGQDPLPPVLPLGEEGRVRPLILHRSPLIDLLNVH